MQFLVVCKRHLCLTRSNVPPWNTILQMPGDRLPISGGDSRIATAAAFAASLMTWVLTGGGGIESLSAWRIESLSVAAQSPGLSSLDAATLRRAALFFASSCGVYHVYRHAMLAIHYSMIYVVQWVLI